MKLYVWNSPFGVAYGGTVAYVVAANIAEAKDALRRARLSKYGYSVEDEPFDPFDGKAIPEPTRIIDGPAAEVYYWSE